MCFLFVSFFLFFFAFFQVFRKVGISYGLAESNPIKPHLT